MTDTFEPLTNSYFTGKTLKLSIDPLGHYLLSSLSIFFEALSISLLIPFLSYLTGSNADIGVFVYIIDFIKKLNFFGFGVLVFALAILTFIYEIQLSTRALSKHLEDLKDLS